MLSSRRFHLRPLGHYYSFCLTLMTSEVLHFERIYVLISICKQKFHKMMQKMSSQYWWLFTIQKHSYVFPFWVDLKHCKWEK